MNDPAIEAQIQDVEELRYKLTRGEEKYFHFGLYITVYGEDEEKLNKIGRDIETILAGRNVLEKQSYLRAEQGFINIEICQPVDCQQHSPSQAQHSHTMTEFCME